MDTTKGAVAEVEPQAGPSTVISALEVEINGAARTDGHVLITGEAGAGHQIAARLIHQRSRRAAAPMVTVTCAGLPDTLLLSELFGHLRGGFAGAYRDKPGLLEVAAHGTLFLEDVGEVSARVQLALLRFLETGEITRIGADLPHRRVDVRILAGANRNLRAKMTSGAFSRPLFDRLNDVSLVLPPLRGRPQDLTFLLDALLHSPGGTDNGPVRRVSLAAMRLLAAYAWPGNVRELEHVVDRIALRSRGPIVRSADLPAEINGKSAQRALARGAR